jgi:hypothetical protein
MEGRRRLANAHFLESVGKMIIDGEIAASGDLAITYIGDLQDTIVPRRLRGKS